MKTQPPKTSIPTLLLPQILLLLPGLLLTSQQNLQATTAFYLMLEILLLSLLTPYLRYQYNLLHTTLLLLLSTTTWQTLFTLLLPHLWLTSLQIQLTYLLFCLNLATVYSLFHNKIHALTLTSLLTLTLLSFPLTLPYLLPTNSYHLHLQLLFPANPSLCALKNLLDIDLFQLPSIYFHSPISQTLYQYPTLTQLQHTYLLCLLTLLSISKLKSNLTQKGIPMKPLFQNKVVWITGGGSGIGKALALEFHQHGAKVAISGRRKHRLQEVCQQIQPHALALPCDVCNEENIQQTIQTILSKWQQLDVVVANAGFGVNGTIEQLSLEDWKRQYNTNVFGTIATIKHSLPALKQSQGRIAIIGSVMGCISLPGHAPYSSSKYAIRSIAQTLSMELHGTGVSCSLIQPGFVESEISQVDNQGHFHPDWKDQRPSFLIWPAHKAAKTILKAIYKRKKEFTFTAHGKFAAFMGKHFPNLTYWLITKFKQKPLKKASQKLQT